jgi:glyoxalase family protein
MRLDGIHHITGITGDGQRCLDFYAGILGLPFIRRDEDFEAPESHLIHLAPEPGRPDGVLSFIEAPGGRRGRAGTGMPHAIAWGVRGSPALEYWAGRLADAGIDVGAVEEGGDPARLTFADPEGIRHELRAGTDLEAVAGKSAAIPAEHAITGILGVRAYGRESLPSADILAGRLGFRVTGADSYRVGERRSGFAFDPPPRARGRVGVGTIHHVAWGCTGGLPAWRQRVIGMGCRATPVTDRGHCHSIYFREPSGVLFEIVAQGADAPSASALPATRELSPAVDPRLTPALVV